jgi:hypothetical protein
MIGLSCADGKPKFKGCPYYKSVCFPQGIELIQKGVVSLPKLGEVKFIEPQQSP